MSVNTRDIPPRRWLLGGGSERTIRSCLILLVVGALLPVLFFAALLSMRYADAERRVIETQRSDVGQNAVFILERDVGAIEAALKVLSESPLITNGDFASFHGYATDAIKKVAADGIVLFDRTGQQLLSTLTPFGQPLPRRMQMERYVPLFAEGKTVISDIVIGTMLQRPIVIVSVPIYRNGVIVYALSAAVSTSRLSSLLSEAGLSTEWIATIVDREGRSIARSRNPEVLGQSAMPQVVEMAKSGRMRGEFDAITRENIAVSNAFFRSPSTGWTVVIAVPKTIYDAPFTHALWLLVLGGAGMLTLGIALAYYFGAQISEPIRQLGSGATALVKGEHVSFEGHNIAEIKQIGRAFDHAASERKRAEDAQALLASIVENSGDPVAVFDFDLKVLAWNRAAETYFGYPAEEVMGKMFTALMPVDRPDESPDIIARIRTGEAIQRETVRIAKDGTRREVSITVSPVKIGGRPTGMSVIYRDISDRNRAEAHIRFILRELSHRSKNLLAVIQAVARQLSRTCTSYAEFESGFLARIQALSHLHDLLISQDWAGAPLADLVNVQLAPFVQTHSGFTSTGPDLLINPNAGQTIALALHELATNAVKYGALSVPDGAVSLTWDLDDGLAETRTFNMAWIESGGPTVTPPTRKGFGHTVLQRMTGPSLGGTVTYDFKREGVVWTLSLPARSLLPDEPMKAA